MHTFNSEKYINFILNRPFAELTEDKCLGGYFWQGSAKEHAASNSMATTSDVFHDGIINQGLLPSCSPDLGSNFTCCKKENSTHYINSSKISLNKYLNMSRSYNMWNSAWFLPKIRLQGKGDSILNTFSGLSSLPQNLFCFLVQRSQWADSWKGRQSARRSECRMKTLNNSYTSGLLLLLHFHYLLVDGYPIFSVFHMHFITLFYFQNTNGFFGKPTWIIFIQVKVFFFFCTVALKMERTVS